MLLVAVLNPVEVEVDKLSTLLFVVLKPVDKLVMPLVAVLSPADVEVDRLSTLLFVVLSLLTGW
jgi:thiamine biosynthesis lipoprotein ApbE